MLIYFYNYHHLIFNEYLAVNISFILMIISKYKLINQTFCKSWCKCISIKPSSWFLGLQHCRMDISRYRTLITKNVRLLIKHMNLNALLACLMTTWNKDCILFTIITNIAQFFFIYLFFFFLSLSKSIITF